MPRYRLTVEFDGRPYMGLQRQAHGPSVQAAIEDAVHAMTGESVTMHAAGRTDAGVHALAMAAHIDVEKLLTPYQLMSGVNAKLRPQPIAVIAAENVPNDWHARFSCTGRRYVYHIINRTAPLTLDQGRAWRIGQPLDADAMHVAAQHLVGSHDFTTFRSAHCQSASPLKSLDQLDIERDGDLILVHAAARSFLHHQVRSMVGCLALVGRGRWSADDLKAALEAKDRAALGHNAPPDGLYFAEAVYT
jgi:tRNA pseudouridine38-40 synthase